MSDYPPQSPPPPAAGTPQPPLSDADAQQWAGLSHLLGGILGFLAPLVIWLVYKDRSGYVSAESKRALNFQLLVTVGYVVSYVLMIVLIGYLTWLALWVVSIYLGYLNFQAVNQRRATTYPVDVQIIK